MKIGFIGTGNIGNPMANQLLKAGFYLTVHDMKPEAAANLVADGAKWADTSRIAALEADVVITSLPGPPEVEAVATGQDGILEGLRQGGTWIEMSTGDLHLIERLAADCEKKGISMLEATVSCGVERAHEGRISVFIGGDKDVLEAHMPIFEALAETIVHVGSLGQATVTKLITNMICFVHQIAFSEGMMLGARAGLELEPLWRAIKASYAASFVAEVDGAKLLSGGFHPDFPLALACKDMRLTSDLAREFDVPMELSALTEQIYARARVQYGKDASCNSVMRLIEDTTGIELRAEID
jgi:3-hydroxyisobutyrate dehydrogenase